MRPVSAVFSILLMACATLAFVPSVASGQTSATLIGTARDSAGRPLADVEVVLRDAPVATTATRSNDRGQFTLQAEPGSHSVWLRRLGYRSVEYTWRAMAGQRTEISVVLSAIPRQLDPVVVRAEEDKRSASRSSILGLVIDTADKPIPEAEVQVVGADMGGTTRNNGGFLFKPLAVGSYVLRVRKLGYAPAMLALQLVQGDEREVVIRMTPLASTLDPFVVTEQSGYGRDQVVYDELEQRKRWANFKTRVLGPEDLKSFNGQSLDEAVMRMGLYVPPLAKTPSVASARARRPTSINGGRGQRQITTAPYNAAGMGDIRHDQSCILLDGKTPVVRPLTAYNTDQIEMLEVYPPGTEVTGTVSWRFFQNECKSLSLTDHPPYYVLWMKP
jgi:hypothetical protein